MGTTKLYNEDAYLTSFSATVLSCAKVNENSYRIILNQTAFFPEQGGQTSDFGYLTIEANGERIEITHVEIDESETVAHIGDKKIEVGSKVFGEINWEHRFSNMQQHSGEHIFSGLVCSRFKYNNVGFHLSDNEVTMDYDGVLTKEDILALEEEANRNIFKSLPINVTFPTEDELKTIPYRSKKELKGEIRIVTIPGVDICACCAPHVARTSEIGLLKVIGCVSHRGGVRVNILCGMRALLNYRENKETVLSLINYLTTNESKLLSTVTALKEDNKNYSYKINLLMQEALKIKISSLDNNLSNVLLFEEGLSLDVMRNAINDLVKEHDGFCSIFNKETDGHFSFIIGSSNKDCNTLANALRLEGFKCGGSPRMIQGSTAYDVGNITQKAKNLQFY